MELALTEDDSAEPAIIEPGLLVGRHVDMPETAVVCFFQEVVEAAGARPDSRRVVDLVAAHGRHPVHAIRHAGAEIAVFHPGVGAPIAAAFLEEAIAMGVRHVVAVGGAGALVPALTVGHAVVVDSAVRDEGTSFHYLAPSRTVDADETATRILRDTLDDAAVPHQIGRSWTTDAFYRETRSRARRRVEEGCVVVEMEASALIAVARYRGIRLAHLLYAGDSLAGDAWDHRGWDTASEVRAGLFDVACDAAVRIAAGVTTPHRRSPTWRQ